jgi:hypothetical protein
LAAKIVIDFVITILGEVEIYGPMSVSTMLSPLAMALILVSNPSFTPEAKLCFAALMVVKIDRMRMIEQIMLIFFIIVLLIVF